MASEVGSDGRVILEVLDRRLNDSGKNWRHVYKSLTVYQYLIENGPEYIVNHAKRNLPAIKTLKEYQYVDETGVDHGQNVRLKSREVAALLVDEAKLGQIRANRGTSAGTARAALQYSGAENNEDDELRRAIELSREQASIDERRRKQNELMRQEYCLLIREADLQRAIEDSERDALDRRRSQINTGKNLVENDDIIDFFGSIEEPKTQFGNFDPFQQQQQLMWQQEQQRMMMEQQQQQYFMQQQQEQARIMMMQQQQMEQQNRQQMLMKQQQEENARQQMMQNQFANQYANHQNNPFAAPAPKKSPLQEPQNPADFSSNPKYSFLKI